jgi:hypothetical protein
MTRFVTRRDGGTATALSLKQTCQSDTDHHYIEVSLEVS